MPSMRILAIVPAEAAAGVCRVCAAAEKTQPAAEKKVAASKASPQMVTRFGTNPSTPGRSCDNPATSNPVRSQGYLQTSRSPKVNEVVPGREHHQGQHQGQPNAEAVLLSALTQRLPADCLGGIEQQMASVKHRHREQ